MEARPDSMVSTLLLTASVAMVLTAAPAPTEASGLSRGGYHGVHGRGLGLRGGHHRFHGSRIALRAGPRVVYAGRPYGHSRRYRGNRYVPRHGYFGRARDYAGFGHDGYFGSGVYRYGYYRPLVTGFTIRPQRRGQATHGNAGERRVRGLIDQSRWQSRPVAAQAGERIPVRTGSASQTASVPAVPPPASHAAAKPTFPTYPEASIPDRPRPAATGAGWQLLARDPSAALVAFAEEATDRSDRGLPNLGYALSSALVGNEHRAIWAMRRAVGVEPAALRYAPVDGELHQRLAALIDRYRQRVGSDQERVGDDRFMLAAVAFMNDDPALAESAVREAIDRGDRQPTTYALERLIESEVGLQR